MKDYAKDFYKSKQWQHCREAYISSVGGLCEECLKNGRYTAGVIVHHITHLSSENIHNESITLSWNNLRLLCRDCHGTAHSKKNKRYKVDEFGNVKGI